MAAHPEAAVAAVREVEQQFARLLTFPMPTLAAVQGHAFAAGVMLALSHDIRLMRADRGFLCLPEVDLGVRFPPGMHALLTSRLAPQTAHRAMALGERFTGPTALAAGMVDATAEPESLPARAVEMVQALKGRRRQDVAAIKRDLYAPALALLGAADPPAELIAGLIKTRS
jgi:enoyl-CoA hydratase/carnithine racemase